MNTPSPRHCANCGELLHGHHCSHCGQEDIEYKDSLRNLVPEVLHEYFGFDSQIFSSIPALLFKPGFLTNEFNAGRRTKYISPLRLYLIVSALYFFLSATGIGDVSSTQNLEFSNTDKGLTLGFTESNRETIPDSLNALKRGLFDSTKADSIAAKGTITRYFVDLGRAVGSHPKELQRAFGEDWPTAMFLLLPVFALLLKLVYYRSKKFYVEHLVYVVHLHSLAFLLFSVFRLFIWIYPHHTFIISSIELLLVIAYALVSLKRVYHRKWITAIPTFVFLGGAYGCIVAIFVIVNILVAAMRI